MAPFTVRGREKGLQAACRDAGCANLQLALRGMETQVMQFARNYLFRKTLWVENILDMALFMVRGREKGLQAACRDVCRRQLLDAGCANLQLALRGMETQVTRFARNYLLHDTLQSIFTSILCLLPHYCAKLFHCAVPLCQIIQSKVGKLSPSTAGSPAVVTTGIRP